MSYICPICSLNPQSHSLNKILEKEDTLYYYTCPSESFLFFDKDGIIKHYNGEFSKIPNNKEWIWIFDGNYCNSNSLHIDLVIEIIKLISKYSNNLKKIIILNSNIYITTFHKIVHPFLNKKMKSVVNIIKEHKTVNDVI
jgi:hypothetical protein